MRLEGDVALPCVNLAPAQAAVEILDDDGDGERTNARILICDWLLEVLPA